jgi:hypothetical protein
MDVRQAIETALDTFEERLKVAEQRGGKAEAQVRQASTQASQADDRIQELNTHIAAFRRKLMDLESDINVKVSSAVLDLWCKRGKLGVVRGLVRYWVFLCRLLQFPSHEVGRAL